MNPPLPVRISRRDFTWTSLAAASGAALVTSSTLSSLRSAESRSTTRLKAAIIGHTGRGNYGHGLDEIFSGLEGVELLAVADPDPKGLERTLAKTRAPRGYGSYAEMLQKEKPDLVSVAPRHTDQHHAMIRAALQGGAHVYSEKPFTTSLAEADDLLNLAAAKGLKIAVAHQMRITPQIVHLKQKIESGALGEIVSLRSHGKQDQRAGGEDMIVLGTHIFDMMRLFVGDAIHCSAVVREKGKPVTSAMKRSASENIGPVVGDEIEARFEFARGVTGTFTTNARLRETLGPWGIEILCSKGAAWILMDIFPKVYVRKFFHTSGQARQVTWEPLPDDPSCSAPEREKGFPTANRRVVEDWLAAIAGNREPACSAGNATRAMEMAMAVYESALRQSQVAIPLSNRVHPLVA